MRRCAAGPPRRTRRAHDADDPTALDAERREHVRIRAEVMEVVLLLEARVAEELVRRRPEGRQRRRRDGLRHRDLVDEAHVDGVAAAQPLVVEKGQLRDAQRPGREGEVGGMAADGHVEAAARGGAEELGGAVHEADGACAETPAAMTGGEHAAEAVTPQARGRRRRSAAP